MLFKGVFVTPTDYTEPPNSFLHILTFQTPIICIFSQTNIFNTWNQLL